MRQENQPENPELAVIHLRNVDFNPDGLVMDADHGSKSAIEIVAIVAAAGIIAIGAIAGGKAYWTRTHQRIIDNN